MRSAIGKCAHPETTSIFHLLVRNAVQIAGDEVDTFHQPQRETVGCKIVDAFPAVALFFHEAI